LPTPEAPEATASPKPTTWSGADTIALFVGGDDERADLFVLSKGDISRVLFPDVANQVQSSPETGWLGFVRWSQDGRGILEVHNLETDETRQVIPDSDSGLFRFAFDQEGRHLAYVELGAPSETGVPWALVVVDLRTGESAKYDAVMSSNETRPLPGAPIGWSGVDGVSDELIIDTFLPYTEGGSMGVWGLTLPASGASAPLEELSARELLPEAPVYLSRLFFSPDAQLLAYLGRNPDYLPTDYVPEFYDLAVNRLGVVALENGSRTLIVDVDDGSALARALAWSPNGERLLFAQGRYDGDEFAELSLKSADLDGTVVDYGPLNQPLSGGLLGLAWCDPSLVLYLNWDGSAGVRRLFSFDLNTGVSNEIAVYSRLEIVSCLP
jgi:hypothetical protein